MRSKTHPNYAPSKTTGTHTWLRNKPEGAPYLGRFSRDAPNFLHVALDKAACAPFLKERRMRFTEPANLHRKSGMWDTTAFNLRTFEPTRNTWLSRGGGTRTGAPGSPKRTWAENDGRSPTIAFPISTGRSTSRLVPKGRLKVAQDAVLGWSRANRSSPEGTAEYLNAPP
jgi:hypothetical protein